MLKLSRLPVGLLALTVAVPVSAQPQKPRNLHRKALQLRQRRG
jgi:hypothetical protein